MGYLLENNTRKMENNIFYLSVVTENEYSLYNQFNF